MIGKVLPAGPLFALVLVLLYFSAEAVVQVQFSKKDLQVVVGKISCVRLTSSGVLQNNSTLWFTYQTGNDNPETTQGEDKYIDELPNITVGANHRLSLDVNITGLKAGHFNLGVNSSSSEFTSLSSAFVRLTLVHSSVLVIVNTVIGWLYFAAWSVSFYPQVYENFKRKSVVGLNFDFLLYNITGFIAYGLFNVGMFWIPKVKDLYHADHPRGINPVQLNDVIFTLHAIVITLITISQCFIYERGGQKLSKVCMVLVGGAWLFAAISLIVTLCKKITWLTYLYYFSYIKLGVTLIKYVPQAYMNYRRKSTSGWSIGNVLLDFTGGSLSLLQMFLLAYNSDDWSSIFGDPTKFGLGFFSILFDILFIIQHYVLYRGKDPYEKLLSEESERLINPDTRNSYSAQ